MCGQATISESLRMRRYQAKSRGKRVPANQTACAKTRRWQSGLVELREVGKAGLQAELNLELFQVPWEDFQQDSGMT